MAKNRTSLYARARARQAAFFFDSGYSRTILYFKRLLNGQRGCVCVCVIFRRVVTVIMCIIDNMKRV